MYQARENRTIAVLPLLAMGVLIANNQWDVGIGMGTLIVTTLAFQLLSVFIHYTVRVDCGMIHYQVVLFQWVLYRNIIAPEKIYRIRFKRCGWKQMGAVIEMKSGRRVRLLHFHSHELMEKLDTFATTYRVDIVKSKDYRLLEPREASKKRPQY